MVVQTDVLIIGSGPAGLTAAIYNARANLKPVVLAGIEFGGQLMTTSLVENYPGFADGIMGPELMQNMIKQAEKWGTTMVYKYADKVDLSGSVKKVWADGQEYNARAVIITVGSSPRKLNVPGEQKFWGKGVSTCATCDGPFYKDKTVAVVGGGDSAMEEAIFLTKHVNKVYLIHRRDTFRASKIMQDRALKDSKIEVIWNTEVKEILGEEKVASIKVMNNQTSAESNLNVDGVFLAIGHDPNAAFLADQIALDEKGYIKTNRPPYTDIDGVFVAGEIIDGIYKQAITSAGDGCRAAMAAEKFLEGITL